MVSVAEINTAVNSARESALSSLSGAPEGYGLQSMLWVVAILMAITLFMQIRKGPEERKGIYGPLAILIFCLSTIFGFNIVLISWILIFILGTSFAAKLKKGEWKGVLFMLIPIYGLSFLVSVKPYLVLVLVGLFSAAAFVTRRANTHKIFGRSEGAKELKKGGYPIRKERRVLRALRRIARKGYKWTRDPIARTASKLKQRFAERALLNEAEQLREAEIVAASEDMSKALHEQQSQLSKLEERDMALVEHILKYCDQLKEFVQKLPEGAVEDQKAQQIREYAKHILKQLDTLVKQKLEEETLIEKANKVLEHCMTIIHHSATEATQLKEHKSDFKELKRTAKQNIDAMRKQIKHETRDLEKGIHQAKHSQAQGAAQRADLMRQRQSGLSGVESKLSTIETYTFKIDKILLRINAREDERIEKVKSISEKAKKKSKELHHYEKEFSHETKELDGKHKKYAGLFKEEEAAIGDVQLIGVTDNTIEMVDHLKKLTDISTKYHKEVVAPMIQEMAQAAQDISHLSKVSERLTKLYFRLSQANEQLTRMAAIVDQNPEAKEKLEKIWKAEQFEEALTRKAYRRGKSVVRHIQEGYKYLQSAYSHLEKHVKTLEGYEHLMKIAKRKVGLSLNEAFKKLLKQEISQAKKLEKEAGQAEKREAQALRAEKAARAAT